MQLDERDISLAVPATTPGGAERPARALSVRPARVSDPLPGLVLIQEAFGIDEFVQDVARRLAAAGYHVIAPDLFSIGGTPPELAQPRVDQARRFLDSIPLPAWFDPAQRDAALATRPDDERVPVAETLASLLPATRPWDDYVALMKVARAWLSTHGSPGHDVGCVGFCLGGLVSLRLACNDPDIKACVVFYGFPPPLDQVPGLQAPVLALHAEVDPRIHAALPDLEAAMRAHGKRYETRFYPGTRHAFMNDTRSTYHVGAARDAWARMLSFFAAELS